MTLSDDEAKELEKPEDTLEDLNEEFPKSDGESFDRDSPDNDEVIPSAVDSDGEPEE